MRIQIGCGMSPIGGWTNFDNSPSVKLAKRPIRRWLASRFGLLDEHSRQFIRFAQENDICYCDARYRIPLPSDTVDVVYSSHTMEHMDVEDAKAFLIESHRVLRPGGTLRLALPDLSYYAKKYLSDGDLEYFMYYLHLTRPRARTIRDRVRRLMVGDRHHQWMYDGPYLVKILVSLGYEQVAQLEAGLTRIKDPGQLNLSERSPESVYVEGVKAG